MRGEVADERSWKMGGEDWLKLFRTKTGATAATCSSVIVT